MTQVGQWGLDMEKMAERPGLDQENATCARQMETGWDRPVQGAQNALSQASFTLASDTGLSAPLPMNPIRFARTFQSQGTLPNGFPEARDLTAHVQSGKVQIRGQSRFSNVDQFSATPPLYLDTSPLPPTDLLRALSPPPQILLSGDGLQYPGFLRSFSVADMPGFDWAKLIGTVSFLMLSAFAPFRMMVPFFHIRPS